MYTCSLKISDNLADVIKSVYILKGSFYIRMITGIIKNAKKYLEISRLLAVCVYMND